MAGPTMKVIDSGMPDEAYWSSLFDVPGIVHWLRLERVTGPIVEIGCGYGTITAPVGQGAPSTVCDLDIEPAIDEPKDHITIMNERVFFPEQYSPQFVFAIWDFQHQDRTISSECNGNTHRVRRLPFRINE